MFYQFVSSARTVDTNSNASFKLKAWEGYTIKNQSVTLDGKGNQFFSVEYAEPKVNDTSVTIKLRSNNNITPDGDWVRVDSRYSLVPDDPDAGFNQVIYQTNFYRIVEGTQKVPSPISGQPVWPKVELKDPMAIVPIGSKNVQGNLPTS